jgi:prolyl 4-hydroxylase
VIPYGVDLNRKSLGHAAALLPSFASNFCAADLFDCDAWNRGRRYVLTLLMAGRLLEVERSIAERLLKTLRTQSDAILVYSYPGVGGRALEAVAREMGFGLDSQPDAIAGLVANTEASRVGEGLSLAGARAAATARPLPDIDTSTNFIALDRAVEILSTLASPRIVLLGNVLSDEECEALVEHCASRLAPSRVIADAQGNLQRHENRTSSDAMLRRGETAIVARVEERLAALARWPVECGEGLQVVRYDPGEEYRPHCDWIDPGVEGLREHLDPGGQRLGTFLLYLSDVASGGDTAFPAIGLRVKPRKGAALFFQNTDARYAPDRSSLHAGCPVIQGVKWVANKWLRQHVC